MIEVLSNARRAWSPLGILLLALLSASCAAPGAGAQDTNGRGAGSGPGAAEMGVARPEVRDARAGVEERLEQLFEVCAGGRAEEAAPYFVYRGPDKAREWKDTMRAGEPSEKAALEEGCRRIKGLLDESHGHSFGQVRVEKESEGEWHALEVSFRRREGAPKKVVFAFLLVKGQFAVGDIDG